MAIDRKEVEGKLLTVEEVAGLLDTTPVTVRRWIASGYLKGYIPRGQRGYIITGEALLEYLDPAKAGK